MARADPARAGLTIRCAIYTRKSSDEGDRILGETELVRNVGRDDHDVAGAHHVFLALRINFRFSLSNSRDLLVGVVMHFLPEIDEVPAGFPVTLMWKFRVAALEIQAVLWATLGLLFGWLTERDI